MLRLGALLTFLSRVLRSVVAVVVARRQRADSPTGMPAITTITTITNSFLHDGCVPAEAASCSTFGFWAVIIRLPWRWVLFCCFFLFISFVGYSFCRWLCLCLFLLIAVVVVVAAAAGIEASRLYAAACCVRRAYAVRRPLTNQFRYGFCTKRTRRVVSRIVSSRKICKMSSFEN